MIKAILFDLGNVLMNFDADKIIRNFRAHFNLEDPVRVSASFFRLLEQYETGDCDTDTFIDRSAEILPAIRFTDRTIIATLWSDIFSKNVENILLLPQLSADYTLIMVSNTNPMHIDFLRTHSPEVFEPFTDFVFSHEVRAMKPQSLMYRTAVEKSGVSAQECLFIDDREENIAAARDFGMAACLYSAHDDLKIKLRTFGVSFREAGLQH